MSDSQAELLRRYAEAILEASAHVNLVSRRSLDRLGEHLVDSAGILAAVENPGHRVGDLGSGAGLPGIVLAILRTDLLVSLVDSRRSKIVFLKGVVRSLGLANVRVVHARIEDLAGVEAYDLAVARALGSTKEILEPSLDMVAPGGSLVLFKGPKWKEERDAASAIAAARGIDPPTEIDVELPGYDRRTTFVWFHVKQEGGGAGEVRC